MSEQVDLATILNSAGEDSQIACNFMQKILQSLLLSIRYLVTKFIALGRNTNKIIFFKLQFVHVGI